MGKAKGDVVTGADLAACLIREGFCPQAAKAQAAQKTGESYQAIAAELDRRNRTGFNNAGRPAERRGK